MKKINKKILVVDRGLFMEYALKLADYFEEVLYYVSWEDSYPRIHEALVGSEWEDGEQLDTFDEKPLRRILNIFDYINEVDAVVFLDIYDASLQKFLEDYGIPTVGSKDGEKLELDRYGTKQVFKKMGMDVNGNERIIGLDNLKEYLKKNTNKFVKVSTFRKTTETFHHKNYELTAPKLDKLAYDLGPIGKIMEFIVEDDIPDAVEEGVDTYTVFGKYPKAMFEGVEIKDMAYINHWCAYDELSPGNKKVLEQVSPLLKEYESTGVFSTEVRTVGNKHYYIDPCQRLGFPTNAIQQEMYSNLGDIIWGLSVNKLVEPEFNAKYGVEVLIYSDWLNHSIITTIRFPKEYRQNIKLANAVKIDGYYHIMNLANSNIVGSVVAWGNTIEECIEKVKKIAETIEGSGITIMVESLEEGIEEFNKMLELKK
jgi:hypothetical protein